MSENRTFGQWVSGNLWALLCGAVVVGSGYASAHARIDRVDERVDAAKERIAMLERADVSVRLTRIETNLDTLIKRTDEDRSRKP